MTDDNVKIVVKKKLKPYNTLNSNFTQVANSMIKELGDPYTFKIYTYLCMRYNRSYNYAFPSYETISKDCNISLTKVKSCIKWLCENKYIIKGKITNNKGFKNNVYYIMYLEIDEEEIDKQLEVQLSEDVIFNEDGDIQL